MERVSRMLKQRTTPWVTAGSASLLVAILATTPAKADDFDFSFGGVKGVIRGLTENGTTSPTAVEVTHSDNSNNLLGLGTGTYTGQGSLTVENNVITGGFWRGVLDVGNGAVYILQLWGPDTAGSPPQSGPFLYYYDGLRGLWPGRGPATYSWRSLGTSPDL